MNTQTPTTTTEPQDRVHDPLPEAALPFPVVPPPSPSGSSRDDEWEEELWPSTPPDPTLVEGESIRQVNIGWLKPHPFSLKIYGTEAADKDLVESIRAVGIQTPLQVTVDGVVISGHRRLEAAKQTHLQTAPVFVVCSRSLPGAVEEEILEANRARVKTNEQKVREYVAFKCIESARAKERNGYRWDLVPNSAPGDAEPKPGVYPRPLTTLVREMGKARDLAAKKVGMAGSTAADGEKVVVALDRLWAEEKYEDHCQLRQTLFKSIHGALKLGLERGWIPKPAQKSKQKVLATMSNTPAGHAGDEHDHEPEDVDEPDDHGVDNTPHELAEVAGVAGDPAPKETKTPTPPTGSTLYRDRPMPTHDALREPLRTVPSSSTEDMSGLLSSGVHPASNPPVEDISGDPLDRYLDPAIDPPAKVQAGNEGVPNPGETDPMPDDTSAAMDVALSNETDRPIRRKTVFHLADGTEISDIDWVDGWIAAKWIAGVLRDLERQSSLAVPVSAVQCSRRQRLHVDLAATLNRSSSDPDPEHLRDMEDALNDLRNVVRTHSNYPHPIRTNPAPLESDS